METQFDLVRILATLRKRWCFILVFTILGGVLAGVISFKLMEPVYLASTTVFVGKDSRTMTTTVYGDIMLGDQLIKDYKEIAKSRTVAQNALKILNVEGITPEQLSSKVKASVVTDTRIFKISMESSDKFFAASAVSAVSAAFRDEAQRIMQLENVQVIDEAKVPTAPIRPNKLLNIFVGMLLGIFVSVALSVIFELLDNSIRSEEDVKRNLKLNVLGTIVDYNKRKLARGYLYGR